MRQKHPPVGELLKELSANNFSSLSDRPLSESHLKEIANHALNAGELDNLVPSLLRGLLSQYDRSLDWNIGSIIQHARPETVVRALSDLSGQWKKMYDFMGLAWCLGEFRCRDQVVIDFLQDVVANANNPESWWRAAFALQKLDVVDAVSYLKSSLRAQVVPTLDQCLSDLGNERHRIGILLHCKLEELHSKILPRVKEVLCDRNSKPLEHIGAAWLIGRLRYLDPEVEHALIELIQSHSYEVTYGVVLALREIRSPHFLKQFARLINDRDPLLRKMAAHALGQIDDPRSLEILQNRLLEEDRPEVLSTITRGIYDLTHHVHRETSFLRRTVRANENGMITDEADKWYLNPDIYHIFSQNQDPENLCFRLAFKKLPDHKEMLNPIDLGSGTGRLAWFILENIPYKGMLHCVDNSERMAEYLEQRRRRESVPSHRLKVHNVSIVDLPTLLGEQSSDLIVANFAFPSKVANINNSISELKAIARTLRPRGHLVTIGWDETFNDELSELWYKYVPDGITAKSFEEWRLKRVSQITSPRNCELTWFKQGLRVPLEFSSVEVATRVMGYLFGRSAAEEILRTRRTAWSINAGVTVDSKEDIEHAIAT